MRGEEADSTTNRRLYLSQPARLHSLACSAPLLREEGLVLELTGVGGYEG